MNKIHIPIIAICFVQVILLIESPLYFKIFGVLFQPAPYFVGYGFGALTSFSLKKLDSMLLGQYFKGIEMFLLVISILMIVFFFFVLFMGGNVNDIVQDVPKPTFLFPHPGIFIYGIIRGIKR